MRPPDIVRHIRNNHWHEIYDFQSRNPGPLNVTGQNIVGINSRGVNLNSIDFSNSVLSGSFANCKFENCTFQKANLKHLLFESCAFVNVDFSDANCQSVTFNNSPTFACVKTTDKTVFQSCVFTGLNLEGAKFEKINFYGSTFAQCILKNASFTNVNLSNANLLAAQLNETSFLHTDLSGAQFTDVGHSHPATARFVNCKLNNAKLKLATFTDASFVECEGENVDCERMHLKNCILERTKISATLFNNSKITGCSFQSSLLENCSFKDCVLDNTDLSGGHWQDCNFTGTRWLNVKVDSKTKISHPMFDSSHVVLLDKSDTIIYPKVFGWIDWEKLSKLGNLPMFGISWTALAFTLLYLNTVGLLNETQFIQTFKYPIPIPDGMVYILFTSIMLVLGSTFFRLKCPRRVAEFSEGAWVEVHKHARILYILEKIAFPRWQAATVFFLFGGAGLAIGLFLYRLYTASRYMFTQWF